MLSSLLTVKVVGGVEAFGDLHRHIEQAIQIKALPLDPLLQRLALEQPAVPSTLRTREPVVDGTNWGRRAHLAAGNLQSVGLVIHRFRQRADRLEPSANESRVQS